MDTNLLLVLLTDSYHVMFNSRLNLLVNSGKYFKIPIIPIPLQPWHFALFSPKGQTEGCENMFPITKSTHMENMRTEVRESRG